MGEDELKNMSTQFKLSGIRELIT